MFETDDPNFSFGDDTSVLAVDACSGLEVPVVSGIRSFGLHLDGECPASRPPIWRWLVSE